MEMGNGDESRSASRVTTKELAALLQAMNDKYRLLFDAMCKQDDNSRPDQIKAREDVHPL
jgi:hypothetical protein